MKNIMSIDPSMNGVTAIVVADYDLTLEEPLVITDFAQVDFRAEGETNPEVIKEIRYQQLELLIEYIKEKKPSAVIMENFIMFRNQMGAHGQSFITSEMIGALDLELRRLGIPVVKPRSSDVRVKSGYGKTEIKPALNNFSLMARGILAKGPRNATAVVVNGEKHVLKDYQIGAKNDHILMAIRHLLNEIEIKHPDLQSKIDKIELHRFTKTYDGDEHED